MKLYNLAFGAVMLMVLSQAVVDCTFILEPAQSAGPVPVISAPSSSDAGKTVLFDGSASYHPHDLRLIKWEWVFPDGTLKEGVKSSYAFWDYGPKQVTLTVTDERGLTASTRHTIEIRNPPPVAFADVSKRQVPRGEIVRFSASRSYDPAKVFEPLAISIKPNPSGQIIEWRWEVRHENSFYPDIILFGETVHYSSSRLGLHEVKLTVTDRGGATDSRALWIEVVNVRPQANFQWQRGCGVLKAPGQDDPEAIVVAGEILLDGAISQDPDGQIVKWEWAVNDMSFFGLRVCLMLETGKSHKVTLWVTDNDGAIGLVTRQIKP